MAALWTTLCLAGGGATFVQNRGQWPSHVRYQALIPGGALFVEDHGLTYVLRHQEGAHDHNDGHRHGEGPWTTHVVRVHFEGSSVPVPEAFAPLPGTVNHFLGNDPARWGVGSTRSHGVILHGIYPGVDLRLDGTKGLKLDWLVSPGAHPDAIRIRYEGYATLTKDEHGAIEVGTPAGGFSESAPVAFVNGRTVVCSTVLEGDRLHFVVAGHDPALPLVIDPDITFSSYSGSTSDNFGFTATYDAQGCLYGGGIVFGTGYPLTTGAVQDTYGGGNIDIGISKWSSDGSILLWSTYLGGARNETPHSMVVNDAGELYLLSATGSPDMPTTPGCFDDSFAGGDTLSSWVGVIGGYNFFHVLGTDIHVTRLSAGGDALLAATFVGGTGNDGLNNTLPLAYNYGDAFRGEIVMDAMQRPMVATSTQSPDIPVSPDAPQPSYQGGGLDAYFFRMDAMLSTIRATYFGGTGADCGLGVQLDAMGHAFFSGGTTSVDLPVAGDPHLGSAQGGTDGFLARFSDDLGTLQAMTYLGTPEHDEAYFVQVDTDGEVFSHGQTKGAYPITPGCYGTPGGSRFLHKLNNDLSTSLWSTAVGSGNNDEDIAPSAFLVTDCDLIYLSGWGGGANNNAIPNTSTTQGLPVTADAFQSTTDGRDFHLMVLEPEATGLAYATFFGGQLASEHVDGGTSRFDKNGTVYQAVCAGCGNNGNDFPTTPEAWSPTNGSTNCNLGVFKFNLTSPAASIAIDGPDHVCLPDAQAQFLNQSTGGAHFTWQFGDGTGSTDENPLHSYTVAGTYTVRMILSDDDACTIDDTTYVQITVVDPFDAAIDPVDPGCPGELITLHASGGQAFLWSPSQGLSANDVADPVVTLDTTITYVVTVTDECGVDQASVTVVADVPQPVVVPEATVCIGNSVGLNASGGASYLWSPADDMPDPTSATPIVTPEDTTVYHVVVTSAAGCSVLDSVLVIVQFGPPVPGLSDTTICLGDTITLMAHDGDEYLWTVHASTDAFLLVAPALTSSYAVSVSNACGTTHATALVEVQEVVALAWPDSTICPGTTIMLEASGGEHLEWSIPGEPFAASGTPLTVTISTPTIYRVIASNAIGCSDTAYAHIDMLPSPWVDAGPDVVVDHGTLVQLGATGNGDLRWRPDATLVCDSCASTLAAPLTSTTYFAEVVDANGCKAFDEVVVLINASLWVPNTFTPDGDGLNDVFRPRATEVRLVRFAVYDRWGIEVFRSSSPEGAWDGTYGGRPAALDTYVWEAEIEALTGEHRRARGHVTLVR